MNNKKAYIIAEAGVNHNGSIDMAKDLVEIAARAGADAVKFQTFITENEISRYAPKADYQMKTTDSDESQFQMVKKLELDKNAHLILIEHCKKHNIEFLSSPFDLESLDLLLFEFELETIKIPSGEITNGPLLLNVAKAGRKVILSTGMCTLGDIETALGVLAFGYINSKEEPSIKHFYESYYSVSGQAALREKVVLLHCTTEYPTPYKDVNLKVMDSMKQSFGLEVGYSDHTLGIEVSIAAAARGAAIIEKHITLDKNLEGPDHQASIDPDELITLVSSIRNIEVALGHSVKLPAASEIKNIEIARKSLVAATEIRLGEVYSVENLTMKRPGTGISPLQYWDFIGKVATRSYGADEVIKKDDC
ncbi:N-acetylneuraminate synthase [Paenibacillus qinlingensis]|uniref:N-acetylneuraminate synthase n=1 Tax=Paenibacillus qinlingensis TaxID=1837343 RepID=UPI0015646D06|nr:N-acetylneuraminate synthase [Paenibacillus qinlingensis]NQX61920.1 N-acetylneuraminate synthase [Paenibacillus qinlingensis]